jgi:hypothetical protein
MPKKNLEKEYEELQELAEKAGITDLSKVYGEYCKLLETSFEYMQEMDQEYSFSTADTSG